MKITDKSQIELPLKCGKYVVIQEMNTKDYQIISITKDGDENWRMSNWCDTIEKCKKSIGDDRGYGDLQKIIDNHNLQIVETFSLISEQAIPVGTLVRVREDAEEICKRCSYITGRYEVEMIGKEYPVTESDFEDVEIDGIYFPIQAVEFVFEDDKTELSDEELIPELQKRGKIKEGKIEEIEKLRNIIDIKYV